MAFHSATVASSGVTEGAMKEIAIQGLTLVGCAVGIGIAHQLIPGERSFWRSGVVMALLFVVWNVAKRVSR